MEEIKILPTRIISSEQDSLADYFKKVVQHRALILTLAKRDLKVKYAQTYLGLAWTIVQPLTAVVVFSLFFSVLLEVKNDYPYVLFVLSGVLIWNLFNYIFSQGSTSLTNNQDLIRKLYFPKIILPLSKVLVALVEFGVTLVLLVGLLIFFQINIGWQIIFSPLIIAITIVFSTAVTLILSAATIKNRDLNHIIPFLINFGIWFTPVFYPVSIIPEKFSTLIYLNPMAGFIELFRWSIGLQQVFNPYYLMSVLVSFILLLISLVYFVKTEDSIADKI